MVTKTAIIITMMLGLMLDHCYGYWNRYQQDYYGSHYKTHEISDIPTLGDKNPLVNLVGEKNYNDYFMTRLVEATGYKTTVFKIQMERERIIISDPIAIHAMYDVRNIEKTLGGGTTEFNLLATGGYHPSFLDNGKSHRRKKRRQYLLMENRLRKFGGLKNVFKYMGKMFQSIKPIESAEPADITSQLDQITQDTMTKLLLGAPLNNPNLFLKWFSTSVKVIKALDPNFGQLNDTYKALHEEMMKWVRTTPVAQRVKNSRHKDYLEKEMMFFTIWLAAGGVVLGQRSSLRFITELSEEDQNLLFEEADKFFECLEVGARFHRCYNSLPYLDGFIMEVLRLESPVANVYGRAVRDFVITSLHGRFQIKKGDWLQGNVLTAQRCPRFFKESTRFDMHRNVRHTKKHFFDFGGPYYQKPTLPNHKCIGQNLAISFLKMFVLHFTRCETQLGPILQSPTKTGGIAIKATKLKCSK